MRIVVQRVSRAAVRVEGKIVGQIGSGLMVLVGVGREDTEEDARYLADKTADLRIFPDAEGKMNRSVLDIQGSVLAVSQFTLYGDCRKGRRPSWHLAAPPELGQQLYEEYCRHLARRGLKVETGIFGAMMDVEIHNDGPVTLLLDSKREF
ncbi:MAG: D-tyrosyl-tRNA(Tyr) deacylase [Firmicutes bacterium]|nr:D-tyrosyl-tRNA(Tyr) deacylase [Bacillota bacterium]HOB34850.1 D-aminoacyl-tRNA deacylase [Bacillota bacterium]HPZ90786.1 D-aminoacyl-tRNA deacylase [Bacillota bacterium]HQE01740.1 D-aminoacyl-tRNA deacylase [Bacillota bacterium]